MVLCEQCGSISISKAQPAALDTLVAIFTSRRPFICRRCGWRARRRWTDEDFRRLENYGVGGAEYDPSLAVLDEKLKAGRRQKSRNGVSGSSPRSRTAASDEFDPNDIDLSGAEVASADRLVEPSNGDSTPKFVSKRPSRRRSERRRRRLRRREILATVAVTALTMFIVVIMSLTGSCVAASEF